MPFCGKRYLLLTGTYLKIADYEKCRHTRESGYSEKVEKTGFPFSRE
jgi:hypothetical protein